MSRQVVVENQLALIKQGFTQVGGMRAFVVSIMICGHDVYRFRLFSTDLKGTVNEWVAHAFGEHEKAILSSLEADETMEKEIENDFRSLGVFLIIEKVDRGKMRMCDEDER